MKKSSTPKQPRLQPNVYRVLTLAVAEGLAFGWHRAYKHDDDPSKEAVLAHLHREVMLACGEAFVFPDAMI